MNTPMNLNEQREQQLERLIDQALRDQPLRRAPDSLEAKVMAEIARRAAAPWWQRGFTGWPVAARVLFLIASVGFAKLFLDATTFVIAPLGSGARGTALFAEVAWIHSLFDAIGAAARALPSMWVYGALAVIAVLYLTLFGVSAAAYRTLYATR
jgi:hypothetical protein